MIITRKHTVLSNKVTQDLNIIQISDLHYSDFTSSEKLNKIIYEISNLKPDYIIFCGDIFTGICKSYDKLIIFFNMLNKISPVYLTYGNHEFMSLSNNKLQKLKWEKTVYKAVLEEIKNMSNIFVLENESIYLDNYNVTISGAYMDFEHYEEKKEDPDDFITKINELFPTTQNCSHFNEIICHSPKVILDEKHFKKIILNKYADLIHSGHMHNGLVPPIIDNFFPKNKGIMGPHGELFPDLSRGKVEVENTTGIIGGPLTTITEQFGIKSKIINTILPSRIEKIYIKKY